MPSQNAGYSLEQRPITPVLLGQIAGLYGVRGWLKVYSYTEPRDNIAGYSPLYLRHDDHWQAYRVEDGRRQGKGVIVKLAGVDDRDQAAALVGADIAIDRAQLPPLAPGEIYWADIEGLRVVNLDGVDFGTVERLFATGANDVMVVNDGERERLIPFVRGEFVKDIDFERQQLRVDWDADF